MMSVYEEKELLQKLRGIFALEIKCKLEIPAFIRLFYRKLCIREWKRQHSRPVFNLDEFLNQTLQGNGKSGRQDNEKTQIIDRYQVGLHKCAL